MPRFAELLLPVENSISGFSVPKTVFAPAAGNCYAVDTSDGPIAVTMPTGIVGDRIGFMDALGASPLNPQGFGVRGLTINPPVLGTLQGLAASLTLVEGESIVLRCITPGNWRLEYGIAQSAGVAVAGRPSLTSNLTYYVRPDGSDANSGLTNSAAGAFKTIQKAVDKAASWDLSLYDITIQLGDGTYPGTVNLRAYVTGGGVIVIQGNATNPENVIVSTNQATGCFVSETYDLYTIKNLKVTGGPGGGIWAFGGRIKFSNIVFHTCTLPHILAASLSSMQGIAGWKITGGSDVHIWSSTGSVLVTALATIETQNSPNFTGFFAYADRGHIDAYSMTFSGSGASGTKYRSTGNGTLFVNGGGSYYLPGNSFGVIDNGGQYY